MGWNSGSTSGGSVTGCYFLKTDDVNSKLQGIGSDASEPDETAVDDLDALCGKFKDDTTTWTIHPVLGRPVLNENWEGGDGSPESPYEISTADQLKNFATAVNGGDPDAHAKLMNNIDLNGNATNHWTPIGTSSKPYSGTFDGANYTISGLYIDSNADYQGLFGYLSTDGDNTGTVQNLTVDGTVSGSGNYVGGVVGYNNGGIVTVCIFSGSGSVSGNNYVGGVVGLNRGSVINCTNTGSVKGSGTGVGGVVGCNSSQDKKTNNNNTGKVSSKDRQLRKQKD